MGENKQVRVIRKNGKWKQKTKENQESEMLNGFVTWETRSGVLADTIYSPVVDAAVKKSDELSCEFGLRVMVEHAGGDVHNSNPQSQGDETGG